MQGFWHTFTWAEPTRMSTSSSNIYEDDELDDLNDHEIVGEGSEEMVSLMQAGSSSSNSSIDDSLEKPFMLTQARGSFGRHLVWSGISFVIVFLSVYLLVSTSNGRLINESTDRTNTTWSPFRPNDSNNESQSTNQSSSQMNIPRRPGTGGLDEPGYKKSANRLSPKYLPRSVLTSDAKQQLAEQWGAWTFEDPDAANRPKDDFYSEYPNRDVPWEEFPSNAWQRDTQYLSNFLNESIHLVERAMEAILGEYGRSKFDLPDLDFEERSKMFHVTIINETSDRVRELEEHMQSNAGWMFENGWQGLQRRILHAIMTEDSFTYVMGGHSSAAGHGNHFWQSYTLQLGKVIEPIFARLGVFFRAHNFGMGGLGTTHNAMGAKDIYGNEIDILYWDSQMTEQDPAQSFFLRTGLISGNRVPVILNLMSKFSQGFNKETGADVGMIRGGAMAGIGQMQSIADADDLPWAARYMNCDSEINNECTSNSIKYNTKCWIPRKDFTPTTHQFNAVGAQASWHPGWRWHQLMGRTQAFVLLRATHAALQRWYSADSHILPDSAWHVTSHYDAIRAKVTSTRNCEQMKINPLFCSIPINARTEFSPRALGYHASIRSIMKGAYVPRISPNVYDPPDVEFSFAEPPEGEVNALHVIENGIDFPINRARQKHVEWLTEPPAIESKSENHMEPGLGMALIDTVAASDNCDGTYDSWCNRGKEQGCLLLHHNDGRGGIGFDGLSGWLVMNLANVKEGMIAIKMELWRAGGSPATENWTCENNACGKSDEDGGIPDKRRLNTRGRVTTNLQESDDAALTDSRALKASSPKPCSSYQFQFAVDGVVTTWDADTFNSKRNSVQRVVDVFELVDDRNLTMGQPRDVELAIRLTGCSRLLTYSLTHVYWA